MAGHAFIFDRAALSSSRAPDEDDHAARDQHESTPPALTHHLIDEPGWEHIAARFGLSGRELQVVQHIFDGHAEQRIAFLLEISPHTVHTYVRRLYTKLAVCDHRELILRIVTIYLNVSPE